MVTVNVTTNMEPLFKTDWDYLQWQAAVSDSNPYSQKDWNQTLLTKINMASVSIFQKTLCGGADTIKIHPNLLDLVSDLEYFENKDGDYSLASRFKIKLDDTLETNKIIALREKENSCDKNLNNNISTLNAEITILNYN